MQVLFPPLKRNVSVSVESTLDLDCNDMNNYSGCDTDSVNSTLRRCSVPARTEFTCSG